MAAAGAHRRGRRGLNETGGLWETASQPRGALLETGRVPVLTSSRLYEPRPDERRQADSPMVGRDLERLFAAALGVETRVQRRTYGGADVLVLEARCADAAELARFAWWWRPLVALRLSGVTYEGVVRLMAVRGAYEAQDPALDGFNASGRLLFARWLHRQGRLAG